MTEILRESLHSSLKAKSKDTQDKFLDTANSLIRKGANISIAIQAGNKAVEQYELELQELAKKKQVEQVQINKAKIQESFKSIKFPEVTIAQPQADNEVDPEEIKSIYFDNEGKLIIEFGDGFTIKSKNRPPASSITLPTTPAVFKPSVIVVNDGFSYSSSTGEITFNESGNFTFTLQFNALPSASNKNIYFYAEEYYNGVWTIGRYTARQIRLVNAVEDQVQITAARYIPVGYKFRFYIWGDSTVFLKSTDLPGTTPGTVTLPAFRLNIA